jgi:hypothetical protein
MVSLPALKRVMLQASRLIKGAAVADRLTICGVSCLILSKDPVPEMAASLSHNSKRRTSSSATLSQLPTIQETEIQSQKGDSRFGTKSFVGRDGDFRQRDVILHLTGGGFFAHTIASDLPFLMEWSSKTGSVVICPEVRNDKASKGGVRLGNHYLIFQIFPPPVCFAPGESFSCCIESNNCALYRACKWRYRKNFGFCGKSPMRDWRVCRRKSCGSFVRPLVTIG